MVTASTIHANIIGWDGMHEATAQIAKALDGHVDHLSVIYSNSAGTIEDGAGEWHAVPQSWYFGRKFARALQIHPPDAVMLQINADAHYDDWPAIIRSLKRALKSDRRIGLWAPDLDITPWPTHVVATGPARNDGLIPVAQTDGVVWALTPRILERLKRLDFDVNNLGWGIDWAALAFCAEHGLSVLRDPAIRITHPPSKGYDAAEAHQHAKNFILQLSNNEQLWISKTSERLKDIRQGENAYGIPLSRISVSSDEARHPTIFFADQRPLTQGTPPVTEHLKALQVSAVVIYDGKVFLSAARNLEGKTIHIDAGGAEYTLDALASEEARASAALLDFMPRPIVVSGDAEGWPVQKNDLGAWQVDGWTALRIGAEPSESKTLQPINGELRFDPQGNPFRVEARLAVHRGAGRLIASIQDASGTVLREGSVRFDQAFVGGQAPEQYQRASLPFNNLSGEVIVSLALEYEASGLNASEPAVFFVAQPQISVAQHEAEEPAPRFVYLDDGVEAAVWHRATIGLGDRLVEVPIALVTDGARTGLATERLPTIRMNANWGHFLEFDASEALRGVVYVNGEVGFPLSLNAGHNGLRVPSRYLIGEYLHFEFRDEAGFRTLWHDWILAPRQLTALDHLRRESRSPFPTELFPQSPSRFKSMRAHCDAGVAPEIGLQLGLAIDALEAGYDALKMKPLKFPQVENPDVSVVIPAHNKVKVSYACMCALLLAYNKASFEVILVDDGSSDETAEFETIVEGITVIRNTEAQRFIRACNAGAEVARGKYVVLLNNDTEPTSGWLDELIAAFERFDKVGLVGSKLLYPDGRLQEAGGIIWGTGDPWNYGRLQNPADPRYSYARQADYLSGAAMMTSKEIWDEVGGLSNYLEPMYFEDTDFAFKIRDHGYTTWFIPSSVVYHYEGITSGTDTSSGFKRFQEVNRPKFKRRWAKAYANFSEVGHKPDLEKDRGITGRVLFIDYTTPAPDKDAGSYAALQEIRLVQSLGYKVTFLPENLAYMGRYTTDMEKLGVEMIVAPFYLSVSQFLEERAHEFDAFYITRYHVVNNTVRTIRELVPTARVIMNGADLHYLRMLRRGVVDKDAGAIDEARSVREEEFRAMRSVDVVLSYNDTEAAVIEAISEGSVKVQKCPWVLDVPEAVAPGLKGRKGISFLGSFQHHPNVEGIEWFAKSVMSDLALARPEIVLSIYGSRLNDRVKTLETNNVLPIGYVEDIEDAYHPHRIFVAPLLSGAGIKGKVLSAIANGIPCVLSTIAAEGTGLRDGTDCFIADNPSEWVEKIGALYNDAKLWEKFRQNGLDLARSRYSFDKGREQMRAAFEAVDLYKSWA